MTIELTEQQQQALAAAEERPPRIFDPRTNATYVLVPAGEYETLREILNDERQQTAIHAVGFRNAANRLAEDQ